VAQDRRLAVEENRRKQARKPAEQRLTFNPPRDPVLDAALSPGGSALAFADMKGALSRLPRRSHLVPRLQYPPLGLPGPALPPRPPCWPLRPDAGGRLPRHSAVPTVRESRPVRKALTVRLRRCVRHDTTVAIDGKDYELNQGHLAGRIATLCRSLADLSLPRPLLRWRLCSPLTCDERSDLGKFDPDRIRDPDVAELATLAKPVDGRGAHRQPCGDLTDGQQPLLDARGQGRDKLLGIRWYDTGFLDSNARDFQGKTNWLRLAVNLWTPLS